LKGAGGVYGLAVITVIAGIIEQAAKTSGSSEIKSK
jgi:hypothetical protein